MSKEITGEVPVNDSSGRSLKYTFTETAKDELIKQGIDVESEIQQALLAEIEREKKLLDESPQDKPQLIEDIRKGQAL